MLWLLLSLIGAAAAAPIIVRRASFASYLISVVPLLGAIWAATQLTVGSELYLPWFSSLGADFVLMVDPLGRLMTILALGIGAGIIAYSRAYLAKDPFLGRFLAIILIFMASMIGVVLADNVLTLFLFWELTSVTSYLLIGYKHEKAEARKHALQALLVTGSGGVAMLVGLILLANTTGTWRISEMLASGVVVQDAALYPAILILILLGALTKSAQFPFHFWLPNAMSAPTPVSAYLHSATMVKAGVFLLAKMSPLLAGTVLWQSILLPVGIITFLLGAIASYFQTDLKRVLAYTTSSILGALTLLLALPGEKAAVTFVLLLLAHALYKAALFIVVGTIDYSYGTRDWRRLGRLGWVMPVTGIASLFAVLSKAGVPPTLGFLAKEKGYMAGLAASGGIETLVTGCLLLGNALMVAVSLRVGLAPFWMKAKEVDSPLTKKAHLGFFIGPLVFSIFTLLLGTLPSFTQAVITHPVLTAWLPESAPVVLKLWHGFNLPLALSALTLLLGAALFAYSRSAGFCRWTDFSFVDPFETLYYKGLDGTVRWGGIIVRRLQSGDLRQYTVVILSATMLLVTYQLWLNGFIPAAPTLSPLRAVPTVAGGLVMIGAVGAVLARNRFLVLTWLSIVGFATSWLFLYYSGPDLALTLLSVETITIFLFALSLRRLPDPLQPAHPWSRIARGAFAGLTGLIIAVLLLKAKWIQLGEGIGRALLSKSLPEGKGSNVVNVILVDFRALDTLGEITVLAISAIGVISLITVFKKRKTATDT